MNKQLSSPTDTFSKLPTEKRERIEAALVCEFADKGYQKASLNTVVGRLGIAKGSLYQYFTNKESIFLHVFDLFTGKIKALLQQPEGAELTLWQAVRRTMLMGVGFIDQYPEFYQLYLNVLFEHEVPRRQELIARVRLFSMEYFGPLVRQGQTEGTVSKQVPPAMAVFLIDAALDRLLQGYARSYLDGGLGLAAKDGPGVIREIDLLLETIQHGLAGQGRQDD